MSSLNRHAIFAVLLALGACSKPEPSIGSVNGKPVTQAEWNAFLKFKRVKTEAKAPPPAMLQEYLERKALAEVIESEKLLDQAAVDAELAEFKKELLISRYFEKYLDDKASPKAIQNYYETHAVEYEERKVHVAHVLFRLNPKMSPEERQAKLTAAQTAHSQITAGKDFGEIASTMSEDRISGKKGGDLGWIREGSIAPVFSQKAFSLGKDQVSEPFETQFGFHVLKVLEPAQKIKKPLEAVQGDIRYQLRAEAKKAEMDRLKAKTKVEIQGGGKDALKDSSAMAKKEP